MSVSEEWRPSGGSSVVRAGHGERGSQSEEAASETMKRRGCNGGTDGRCERKNQDIMINPLLYTPLLRNKMLNE